VGSSVSLFRTFLIQNISAQTSGAKMGDFIIVLPSSFIGGNLELRHDGENIRIKFDDQSSQLTSTVAAYVGVEQIMDAVESGYRLGLVYDIVYRGARPLTLADLDSPKQRLRKLLRAWQQDAPQFLACLLQNTYEHSAMFDAYSLRGADQLLVSTLGPVAQELQFSVHLANIEVTVKTMADCSHAYDSTIAWDESRSISVDEESFASFFTDSAEDVEKLTVTQIFDLEGIPVDVDGLEMDTSHLISGPDVTLHEPDSTTFDTNNVREFLS
jgi:hypothetical protein